VTVVHDINNAGEPARLPYIHEAVLAAVDPRRSAEIIDPTNVRTKMPTHIVVLSQYLPDGLLFAALGEASRYANVYIPRQPRYDHRSKAFPYNLHTAIQSARIRRSSIESPRREVSSHVKAMLARYDDGSATIIGATDNFATHLQKMVRNEELALIVNLNLKEERDSRYFADFVELICGMREITEDIKNDLLS
jgi:hypothetical protein